MLRKFGYSDYQIGEMCHHAFFLKYMVVGFDPRTGLANVVLRTQTAMSNPSTGEPVMLKGKVIIFAAVAVVFVVWFLFAQGEETVKAKPARPVWLMVYNNQVWYADCIANPLIGGSLYTICKPEGAIMSAHVQAIPVWEGFIDRFVFLGLWTEVIGGKVFWHWYSWDFWDVSYIGLLTRIGPNMYRLKGDARDRFAPRAPYVKPISEYCDGTRAWWDQLTKFW